jgi:nitrogen fixation NifU-like protein
MSDALYQKAIVEKARSPAVWPLPDASGAGRTDNPLCGDRVDMAVRLADGRVAAVGHRVRGCLLCEASAAIIAERAPGLDAPALRAAAASVAPMLSEAAAPPWPELAIFEPVRAHKSRHECVLLPFRALVAALDAADPAR